MSTHGKKKGSGAWVEDREGSESGITTSFTKVK
jgi:hypothetical protein